MLELYRSISANRQADSIVVEPDFRLMTRFQSFNCIVAYCCLTQTACMYLEMSLLVSLSLILLLAVLGHLYTKSGVPANWSWTEILTKPGEKVDNLVIRRQFYALYVQYLSCFCVLMFTC